MPLCASGSEFILRIFNSFVELAESLVRFFRRFSARKCIMASTHLTCPSCGKMNVEGGRYCIQCGAILNPIYCSLCGTKNPDGLEKCLECGSTMPSLAGLRWNPIVTVLTPTSAMTEEKQSTATENPVDNSTRKRVRAKVRPDRKTVKANDTSASSHT